MSSIANIAIQDGAGTPVTHTFYPITSGQNSAWRENQTGLALIGQGVISLTVKEDKKSGLNRVLLNMQLPALETASGENSSGYTAAPKVAYVTTFKAELIMPSRGTAVQRKDLRVLFKNLLLDTQIIDAIENINSPF